VDLDREGRSSQPVRHALNAGEASSLNREIAPAAMMPQARSCNFRLKDIREMHLYSPGRAMAVVEDPEGAAERRAHITADLAAKTGIDDAMIERLVRTFYGRVQADPLIGPVFATRIHDWEAHITKLCAFWSSVALMTGRYHGQPMPLHMNLPVGPEHFDRWISLFEDTANTLCPPAAAAHFSERARRIADSFELGIAARHGRIARPRFSTVERQSVRPSARTEQISCG
jgi:hemoglobin